mmetsp:Transcript_27952/g.60930  ORF Transcript_27952/g.60930 Transcript_27952/m.60930 type:complete len:126 (-) Transcript_27952:297-674(-)
MYMRKHRDILPQSSSPKTAKALATCAGIAGNFPVRLVERFLEEVEGARPELGSAAAWDVREGVLTGDTGGGVATREPGVGVMQGETLRLRIWGKCKPGVFELLRDVAFSSTSLRMLSFSASKSSG